MAEPRPFDPEAMLRTLARHKVAYVLIGGLAASLHGSPHVTTDVDITPQRARENLERLAAALVELDARIRTEGAPDGLPFDRSAQLLARTALLNLTTLHGDLDLTSEPAGTAGYDDLRRSAVEIRIRRSAWPIARTMRTRAIEAIRSEPMGSSGRRDPRCCPRAA